MSKIAARFWVQKVTKSAASAGSFTREVFLAPVVRPATVPGAEGNVDWSKYTPSGEFRLVITNELSGQQFEDAIGQDVKITMEIVDPSTP